MKRTTRVIAEAIICFFLTTAVPQLVNIEVVNNVIINIAV